MEGVIETIDDVVIEIPGRPEVRLPLEKGGRRLSLCLIETGFRPNRKQTQVKNKKQLLEDNYNIDSEKLFSIYRGVVYYNGADNFFYNTKTPEDVRPDFSIKYRKVPSSFFDMSEEDLETLSHDSPKKAWPIIKSAIRLELPGVIEYLLHRKNWPDYSNIRGSMTEYLFRQDFQTLCRTQDKLDIQIHPCLFMGLSNDRYRRGTEVDALLAFYDDNQLRKMLGRFFHQNHISVKTRNQRNYNIFSRKGYSTSLP